MIRASNLPGDTAWPDVPAETAMAYRLMTLAGLSGPSTRSPYGSSWYRDGFRADDGSWSVSFDGKARAAGTVAVLIRGRHLSTLPDLGHQTATALADAGLIPRRCDVRADSEHVEGALLNLYLELEYGRLKLPRGLTWSYDRDGSGGHTLYLGSRSSDAFMRLYDRRGPDRLEVQTRDDRAGVVFAEFVANADARGMIDRWLDRYGAVFASGPGLAVREALRAVDRQQVPPIAPASRTGHPAGPH